MLFNQRVLEEAEDPANPLLERVKFLAITASNLDEFIEIRVASLLQHIEDAYGEPQRAGRGGPYAAGAAGPAERDSAQLRRRAVRLLEPQPGAGAACGKYPSAGVARTGRPRARLRAELLRQRGRSAADAGDHRPLASLPPGAEQGAVHRAAAALETQQRVVAQGGGSAGCGHGSARPAPPGPASQRRGTPGLHHAAQADRVAGGAHVPWLRGACPGPVPGDAQQQPVSGGGRVAQRTGECALRAAQPAQGRRRAHGDRAQRARGDHRAAAHQLRTGPGAGLPHQGAGEPDAPDESLHPCGAARPEVSRLPRTPLSPLAQVGEPVRRVAHARTSCCITRSIPTRPSRSSSSRRSRTPRWSRWSRRCIAPARIRRCSRR